ncbi:MAG: hypothetical protein K2N52_04720, partial [Clostridia bacterium]|nr:hypothetical protein [Clostridia bacterium]
MKKLFKYFMFVILCFCLVLPFAGCSEKKYGGVVSRVEDHEEYETALSITFNAKTDIENYCYLCIGVLHTDFETFGCKNLEALLKNEEFKNIAYTPNSERSVSPLGSCYGKGILPKGYSSSCAYILLYNGFERDETSDMT